MMLMVTIYVGDARDIIKRIRTDHCSGNVEASALRQHVAQAKGYTFTRTKRASGSTCVRLNLSDPHSGEQDISAYLCSGIWKYVLCASIAEARDFQWYVIAQLQPALNVNHAQWSGSEQHRYSALLHTLTESPGFLYSQLVKQPTGPGVYTLYHEHLP